LVYPDLEFDSELGIDTKLQLTNTSEFLTSVKCWYVNANGHCGGFDGTICRLDSDCSGGLRCEPGWQATNFRMNLTKRQPLSWNLSDGLSQLPLNNTPGQANQFNDGSIPPAPEDPFIGEMRCVELALDQDTPSDRNDLKGESTFVRDLANADPPEIGIDAHKTNAIAIKAIEGAQIPPAEVLNIGGPEAEYGAFADGGNPAGCPNIWTLNHYFDGAQVTTHAGSSGPQAVRSRLTIVPCEADFLTATAAEATIQFLIYNEFEQRFSTSTRINCYADLPLSDIDTRPGIDGDAFSIFSVGTQGTLTGMSRLRSVAGPDVDGYDGRGILAILEEHWGQGTCTMAAETQSCGGCPKAPELACVSDADCTGGGTCEAVTSVPYSTTGANVQFQSRRNQGDRMTIVLP
jgi:hypothetical protein